MKKNLLTILFTTGILVCLSQDTTKVSKVYGNEFGIDATGFVKQFLSFNQQAGNPAYSPYYFLTYRRHFKSLNIRSAAGGSYAANEIAPFFSVDSNSYNYFSYSVIARIGCEFFTDLSKRWEVFYGLDLRPGFFYTKNDASDWDNGYANGIETKTQVYGIAPLLGFRFRLIDRLSISTETSFSINLQNELNRHYFTPVASQYPALEDVVNPGQKLFTGFEQPLSVFLTFNF